MNASIIKNKKIYKKKLLWTLCHLQAILQNIYSDQIEVFVYILVWQCLLEYLFICLFFFSFSFFFLIGYLFHLYLNTTQKKEQVNFFPLRSNCITKKAYISCMAILTFQLLILFCQPDNSNFPDSVKNRPIWRKCEQLPTIPGNYFWNSYFW